MIINCKLCGAEREMAVGHVNRSRRIGAPLYCGRKCAGLARRKNRTDKEKKALKRLYDIDYRHKNAGRLKSEKATYHKKTYDPDRARAKRKKRAGAHAEYCRQPAYKKWKQNYDRGYRAKKLYGEFWECFLVVQDIGAEALSQATRYEIYQQNGTLGKTQKRKRDYERTYSTKSETGALGNLEQPL